MLSKRAEAALVLVLALTILPTFAGVTWKWIAADISDHSAHLHYSRSLAEGQSPITSPHFLLQILTISLGALLPFLERDFQLAMLLLLLAAYVLTGVILYWMARQMVGAPRTWLEGWVYLLLILALLTLTPITLFFGEDQATFSRYFGNRYFGFLYNTNVYHNPTIILLKPLALLNFLFALAALRNLISVRSNRVTAGAAASIVLSALAKPSYLICLLPSTGLLALLRRLRGQVVNWRLLIWGIVAPSVAILSLQYYYTFSSASQSTIEKTRIVIAPFLVLSYFTTHLPIKFLLSILFPLSVYLSFWRQARKSLTLNFAWLGFLFGAAYSYLLAQAPAAGPASEANQQNFPWSGQITLFVLFAVSAFFLARHLLRDRLPKSRRPAFEALCILAFAFHSASGVIWLAESFSAAAAAAAQRLKVPGVRGLVQTWPRGAPAELIRDQLAIAPSPPRMEDIAFRSTALHFKSDRWIIDGANLGRILTTRPRWVPKGSFFTAQGVIRRGSLQLELAPDMSFRAYGPGAFAFLAEASENRYYQALLDAWPGGHKQDVAASITRWGWSGPLLNVYTTPGDLPARLIDRLLNVEPKSAEISVVGAVHHSVQVQPDRWIVTGPAPNQSNQRLLRTHRRKLSKGDGFVAKGHLNQGSFFMMLRGDDTREFVQVRNVGDFTIVLTAPQDGAYHVLLGSAEKSSRNDFIFTDFGWVGPALDATLPDATRTASPDRGRSDN